MGGGHGGEGSTTYKGVTLHHPKRWHTLTGKGMCAMMWFWVFYRAKQDGPVVLGWRHPWDGHEDHAHGHGHEKEHEIHSKRRNRLEQKRLNALVFVKYNLQLEQRELSRRGEKRNMDPICLSDIESDDEWITETEDPTLPLVEDAWAGVSECFATQDLEATLKKPRKKSQGPRNTQIGASQSAKGKGKAVVEDDEYGYSSEEGLEDDEEEEEERGDIDEEEEEED